MRRKKRQLTNVTVAGLEGVANSITDLTLGRLPGAETDRGDGSARVELEVRSRPVLAGSGVEGGRDSNAASSVCRERRSMSDKGAQRGQQAIPSWRISMRNEVAASRSAKCRRQHCWHCRQACAVCVYVCDDARCNLHCDGCVWVIV